MTLGSCIAKVPVGIKTQYSESNIVLLETMLIPELPIDQN